MHLCQIQLRLYHGLLTPEGHQVAQEYCFLHTMQKNGLAPLTGKSDIAPGDTPVTEVSSTIRKHQWGLLHSKVLLCHRWARISSGQVSTPPYSSLELIGALLGIIVLFCLLQHTFNRNDIFW